jgi:hypothetical protein
LKESSSVACALAIRVVNAAKAASASTTARLNASLHSDYFGGRAMVHHRRRAKAPDEVAVELWPIQRHLADRVSAQASPARGLSAAIAITDNIVAAVRRMTAGAHPRGWRRRRTRGTIVRTATAATTQEAVHRAVFPIVASRVVFDSAIRGGVRSCSYSIDGQQRNHRRAKHEPAEIAEKAAP